MQVPLEGLPTNSYDFLSKFGLRRNVQVVFKTARAFGHRSQIHGKATRPIKLTRCTLRIVEPFDEYHDMVECTFGTSGYMCYYKPGDVIEVFRISHLLKLGVKLGDFLITGYANSSSTVFHHNFWCKQFWAIALIKR